MRIVEYRDPRILRAYSDWRNQNKNRPIAGANAAFAAYLEEKFSIKLTGSGTDVYYAALDEKKYLLFLMQWG